MTRSLTEDLKTGFLAELLADIAEDASRVILPYWRAGAAVETKADDSPVTQADREAEALILARLADLYPEVQAVAEEAVSADGAPAHAEARFWLIDPLDGTRGFIRGGESYTVNIALIEAGAPVAGVVSAPAMGLTWRTGLLGDRPAAFRRRFGEAWQEVRVRPRPESGVAIFSHTVPEEDAARLAARHGCTTWQGADSSLKFCLIAEGRCDAYPRPGPTCEWDTAAGQAVLEAAGGRVLTDDGQPLTYGKPRFGNPGFLAIGG